MADAIPGGDFERALLADVAALDAKVQQRCSELSATVNSNFLKFQAANRGNHQALFGSQPSPPPAAPADGSLT